MTTRKNYLKYKTHCEATDTVSSLVVVVFIRSQQWLAGTIPTGDNAIFLTRHKSFNMKPKSIRMANRRSKRKKTTKKQKLYTTKIIRRHCYHRSPLQTQCILSSSYFERFVWTNKSGLIVCKSVKVECTFLSEKFSLNAKYKTKYTDNTLAYNK